MKRILAVSLSAIGSLGVSFGEDAVKPNLESLSLFKNGLAVVRMTGKIPATGKWVVDAPVDAVHGTLWVAGQKPVTVSVETIREPLPLAEWTQPRLLRQLAGRRVTLHLEEDTVTGVLQGEPGEPEKKSWSRDYPTILGDRSSSSLFLSGDAVQPAETGTILLKTEEGRWLSLREGEVRRVAFDEWPALERERPGLAISGQAGDRVAIEFITRGLSWAPAYRIDLSQPMRLSVSQTAAIRNEWAELPDTELRLISGFPSVRFASVDSPLALQSTWRQFFQQVIQSRQAGIPGFDNGLTQQIDLASNRVAPNGFVPAAPEAGEGVDLHYRSIGKHRLAVGEARQVTVETAEADYRRAVWWRIPDLRDAQGRPVTEYDRRSQEGDDEEAAWDVVVFRNPFGFPMTTGPAALVEKGQFIGQQLSSWANPGAETQVRINRALSVSKRAVENEVPESREELRLGGRNGYRTRVSGSVTVGNHRAAAISMLVVKAFSGRLVSAEGDPASELLESGVYSINPRRELRWTVDVPAGGEVTLKYEYEVLVL